MQITKAVAKYFQRRKFDWLVRDVLRTPPLEPVGSVPVIVSMLCHRDVLMYLLAIKSFYRALGRGRIVIIDDGTLTPEDRRILDQHVRPSEYVQARALSVPDCPGYISWKKLFCIARYVRDDFTIQLDSDTLTLNHDLPEVQACIDGDSSFILGTWENQTLVPMAEAVAAARKSQSEHVQMVSEKNFDRLPNYESLRYVRGCSGFDGFARNAFDLEYLQSFSRLMFGLIGDKWNDAHIGNWMKASDEGPLDEARSGKIPEIERRFP